MSGDLAIERVEGVACSVPLERPVRLGIGTALKREAVVVKVTTRGGLVGWGEAHHCRAPAAVEALVNTTIGDLVVGLDALESEHVWERVYANQLASHGTGAAACCALSGLDLALWDIRGKAAGWPLHRLLGGSARPIPAYAGGVALGYQPPEPLVEEVAAQVAAGFEAVKLRVGQGVAADAAAVRAVREAFPHLVLLADANAAYSLEDALRALPAFEELELGWLEEPFPPHARRAYREAARRTSVPIAAGENHYLRFDFAQLLEEGAVGVFQADVSKCGGVSELLRIGALASAAQVPVCPHTSITGINQAATVHMIAALPTGGWFEADVAAGNTLRTRLCSAPFSVSAEGTVTPLQGPGIGVEVDEEFLRAHPLTPGSGFLAA